ncbi:MAG: lytic transglycosylase domain-containing protein, partial [Clostridia bacterium]|nr:lytic transglycosylase domain-containing protein [Clostridia bacterium]
MKLLKRFSCIFLIITIIFIAYFAYDVGGYGKILSKVKTECKNQGVSVPLVLSIIKTESNFNKNAVSNKGAIGLMQLTQNTANYIASLTNFNGEVNLYSEDVNICLGVEYIKYLSGKFGDENAVICAYNAGETKVKDWLDSSGVLQKEKVDYKE